MSRSPLLSLLLPAPKALLHTEGVCRIFMLRIWVQELTYCVFLFYFSSKVSALLNCDLKKKWTNKNLSLLVWHKGLTSITTLSVSFYLILMVILDVSFPLRSLPIISELAHLLWWIPGPWIAISSVNNLNRNSFNWLEWGIFQLKVRYINLNISFPDKIYWQVSFFPSS